MSCFQCHVQKIIFIVSYFRNLQLQRIPHGKITFSALQNVATKLHLKPIMRWGRARVPIGVLVVAVNSLRVDMLTCPLERVGEPRRRGRAPRSFSPRHRARPAQPSRRLFSPWPREYWMCAEARRPPHGPSGVCGRRDTVNPRAAGVEPAGSPPCARGQPRRRPRTRGPAHDTAAVAEG